MGISVASMQVQVVGLPLDGIDAAADRDESNSMMIHMIWESISSQYPDVDGCGSAKK